MSHVVPPTACQFVSRNVFRTVTRKILGYDVSTCNLYQLINVERNGVFKGTMVGDPWPDDIVTCAWVVTQYSLVRGRWDEARFAILMQKCICWRAKQQRSLLAQLSCQQYTICCPSPCSGIGINIGVGVACGPALKPGLLG